MRYRRQVRRILHGFIAIAFIVLALVLTSNAQDGCPSGKICLTQETANKLFNTVEQLIAAKDVIAKMLTERGASDAALSSAMKVIEGWKELDAINGMMVLKYQSVIALYEKTLVMYQSIVDVLEKRLNKPKSAFSRFVDALKTVTYFLAGIALGRGL